MSSKSALRTEELASRAVHEPDHEAEVRALVKLTEALASAPQHVLQTLEDAVKARASLEARNAELRSRSEALSASERRLSAELEAAERLQHVATKLVQAEDSQALYEELLDTARAVMNADFASIQMFYPERGALRLLAFRGFEPEAARFWEWVHPSAGCTCGVALHTRERVIVSDVKTCDFMTGTQDLETYLQTGIRAVQSTPLISGSGTLVGMISTHWRAPHVPVAAALGRLDVIARLAADVIERSRAERALRDSEERYRTLAEEREELLSIAERSRAEAERANNAKDEFLAMVSHELRSPMNAMLGWLRILKSAVGRDPELVAKAVDTIERNVRVQAQVISDLLDVSRIMSGKLQLEHERVDAVSVVMECVESLRPLAEGKQIALRVQIARQESDIIGDGARLQQIVGNLLGNALKFTDPGGFITVRVDGDDAEVKLSVTDTGRGISADLLPHVFERFWQADNSTGRKHGGLGLGLAIVKHVVDLHGGRVEVESAGSGCGSHFTVTLPRAEGRHGVAVPSSRPDAGNGLAAVDVLLVEDDDDSRLGLEMVLEESGARVRSVASVRQALEAYDAHPPDVLLSDIGMPGGDGYALIRAIREREEGRSHRTLAIAMTGFASRHDSEKALRAGFDEHFGKPVEPNVLFARLRRCPR